MLYGKWGLWGNGSENEGKEISEKKQQQLFV